MEARLDDSPIRMSEGWRNLELLLPLSMALRSLACIVCIFVPVPGAQAGNDLLVSASFSSASDHKLRAGCSASCQVVALSSFAPPCLACPRSLRPATTLHPQLSCRFLPVFQAAALILSSQFSPPTITRG